MRAFAYRLLGRREYSIVELGNRIRQKWPEAEDVGELVGQLAGENLVSDERYAEAYTRSRVQRHQGPLKIRAAMRGKGVPDSIIAAAMEAEADNWLELARNWLQKQQPGRLSFKDKQKYYRRLVNRGFTHDQAMDALNRTHSALD
jgi:regulatory protein